MNRIIIDTPIGKLELIEKMNKLARISFEEDFNSNIEYKETIFLKDCSKQLKEYFNGERKSFQIPLYLEGTDFQLLVWRCLSQIPYGNLKSYQDIAELIGNPKACRAVGMANHDNPIPIIIPCHRVIGKNRKLVGYAGGINRKEYLLSLEMNNKNK